MTPAELKLAALMLDRAADEFSRHGCNDFDLQSEGGLTREESREIQYALHKWTGRPDEEYDSSRDSRLTMDWLLCRYLADKLEETND